MMKKDKPWDITNKEQTQLKLDILKKYLKPWADIIGNNFKKAYYIDCFAGRGKYHKDGINDCVLGSPLIAQHIALNVQDAKLKQGKNFELSVIAIESNNGNFKQLKEFLKEADPDGNVNVEIKHGNHQELITEVIESIGDYPAFFFVDPYGIKPIPKESLDPIINRAATITKTEILLNYMSMGVKRVAGLQGATSHQEDKIRLNAIKSLETLTSLFGDDSWVDKEGKELLTHFANSVLREGFKVILNFDVPYPDRSDTIYNLLFATNNIVAKRIMGYILTKNLFKGTLFEKVPFEVDHELQ